MTEEDVEEPVLVITITSQVEMVQGEHQIDDDAEVWDKLITSQLLRA